MGRPVHGVVLAGGSGSRLRELAERFTGRPTPKQFCRFGGPSLLQETLLRITPMAPSGVVVVDDAWAHVARTQLRALPAYEILCQPCDRGTGPGVLLPLTRVLHHDPDALVLVSPADHAIRNGDVFRAGISAARAAVADGLAPIVLLAVEAGAPRTDYGWIVPGPDLGGGLRRVEAFVEKPPQEEAASLLAGGALWNTMVLVGRGPALRDLFAAACPVTTRFLEQVAVLPPHERAEWLRRCYDLLGPCDFSRDIVGAARGLAVLAWPRDLGWTDLGTPDRLLEWLRAEGPGAPEPPAVP